MNHQFLATVLKTAGFKLEFCKWIRILYQKPQAVVQVPLLSSMSLLWSPCSVGLGIGKLIQPCVKSPLLAMLGWRRGGISLPGSFYWSERPWVWFRPGLQLERNWLELQQKVEAQGDTWLWRLKKLSGCVRHVHLDPSPLVHTSPA